MPGKKKVAVKKTVAKQDKKKPITKKKVETKKNVCAKKVKKGATK